jgi:ABC-type hemin transport system ATPase subunit
MLLLVDHLLFILLRIFIVQDYFDYLHRVVPHLFDLALGAVHRLPPLVLFLFDEAASELELVLLEVVIKIAEQLAAAGCKLLVRFDLLNVGEEFCEASHVLLAEGVLMEE